MKSPAPVEMRRLLDEFAQVGRLDSEGTFTVDLSKAQDKLQMYRLETPSSYLLSLVAAANSSGARHLWINQGAEGILACHDGEIVSTEELQDLFSRISAGAAASKTYLTELGIAIRGARALSPERLVFESGDRDSGTLFILNGEDARILNIKELPHRQGVHVSATNRFYLHYQRPSLFQRLLGQSNGGGEEPMLRRFALFSPCRLFWNNVPMPVPPLGGWDICERLDGESRMAKIELVGNRRLTTDNAGSFSGYLGFGKTKGVWLIINDGVRYQVDIPSTAAPNSRAIVFTGGLKKDLSGQKLIDDIHYQNLISAIRAGLDSLRSRA